MEDTIILDHVADASGAELHRLAKLYSLPDFVKQAEESVLRPGPLPASVYADPRGADKLYPCQDPASTYLSCLFFQEKRGYFRPNDRRQIRQRLDNMAQYWGIKTAVDEMRARHAEARQDADARLPDSDFALVRVSDTGHGERHWRLKNALEVKAAAAALHEHRDSLPYADRQVIGAKILAKAAEYGASLGEHEQFVERQAGRGVCDPAAVSAMLRGRAKIAGEAGHRGMLVKLAQTVESRPAAALDPATMIQLAGTVDAVDRASGLSGHYSDALPRPEDVIFSATLGQVKQAADAACALTTGSVYDQSQFSKVSVDDLASLFGRDLAEQVTTGLDLDPVKLAAIAETLPRPDAELFEQLLTESGVPPMARKSASDRAGLSPAILQSLGRHYRAAV